MEEKSSRLIQEAVRTMNEMDDTKYDVVVVGRGVDFGVVGVGFFQIGLSQVLWLEVFRCDSANNHSLDPGNGKQFSRLHPLHHHSLRHPQHPRSSNETSLVEVLALAISTRRASKTFLRPHEAITGRVALDTFERAAAGKEVSDQANSAKNAKNGLPFSNADMIGVQEATVVRTWSKTDSTADREVRAQMVRSSSGR
jgi:hypothetical protein